MMLWFGFENSIDNTSVFQLLLNTIYKASRPFLFLAAAPASKLKLERSWEETQPRKLTPADQRNIPDHTASCSAIKTLGKEKESGDPRTDGVYLHK